MDIKVCASPAFDREITHVEILNGRRHCIKGKERSVLFDLLCAVQSIDPDVILFPYSETWLPCILERAGGYGIDVPISRTGRFLNIESKSYWSYSQVRHKKAAIIPQGRVLIDTARSFNYRKSGMRGILLASRLLGIPPNLAGRFIPGTLISAF